MANFVKVENGVVTQAIVAEPEFFDTFIDSSPGKWIESSDTGIGFTYDVANDVFIRPKPYDSWTLDEDFDWQPPVEKPDDGEDYIWNEENQEWDAFG